MNNINAEVLEYELDKGLGEGGDLILEIACYKCDAVFELSKESVSMAIATQCTFIEYLRYVQSSKCPKCNKDLE